MSFWDLSDGGSAKDTGTEYEVPGGNMEPIPANSDVLAAIEDVKWQTKDTGERYIEAKWRVHEPQGYANRVIFHKLWVEDFDPNAKSQAKAIDKRDKARRMLASIDANAGGKLMQNMNTPTDESLALALCNKPMVIKVMVWEMEDRYGQKSSGNWIAAIKPKGSDLHIGESAPATKPSGGARKPEKPAPSFDLDDEIPF